uniref:ATP synthase subunit a n=1 Tax=Notospermus geniculatus TaxID=416868 RepID=A0A4Y5RUP4_9BILA|nr:ATP synthase F0 subunit 6 [Notospermus geniculatus]QCZ36410.1 ATP synthase F0 subunit 6 [Notospermus geniculatus]
MLMDIFSSFDEQGGNLFGFGVFVWVGSLLPVFFFFSSYWWGGGRLFCFLSSVGEFSSSEVSRSRGGSLGGFCSVLSSLMVVLLCMNLFGLVPYVFSNTSHLLVTFGFSSVLWLSLLLSGVFFNVGSFLAVFLPVGSPSVLSPFLVVVESVSLLVRPVTLAVRLAANMGAGHIVLCLLGSYLSCGVFLYSWFSVFFMVLVGGFYFLFEVGICLIQSYIFFLLLSLYGDEHC